MHDKHYLLPVTLLCVILLSACVNRAIPDITPAPIITDDIQHSETSTYFQVSEHTETSERAQINEQSDEKPPLLEMLSCIERVEHGSSKLITKEIAQLQAKLKLFKVLDQRMTREQMLQKFLLACLLSRDSTNEVQLARAQTLLKGLDSDFGLEEEKLLVRQLGRTISLKIQLRQQQEKLSQLRDENHELLDKIEHLKGLERDLDVTNLPTLESAL